MFAPPPLQVDSLVPAIRWWMWVGFALCLVIARFLPVVLPRRSVGPVICGALAVAAISLHVIVSSLDATPRIERTATLDQLTAELERTYQRDRPTLLIIGSSRCTLGVDGAALERRLQVARPGLQVLQFCTTGHYALEQLHTTRKLIERLHPEQLTVLVELGSEIDLGVPDDMAYTVRGIAGFDARVAAINFRLWRSARAGNADHPAYTYRQLLRTLSHAAQRSLGVGLAFDLQPAGPPGVEQGFVPNATPPAADMVRIVRDELAQPASATSVPSDRSELVRIVRTELAEDLADHVPDLQLLFFYPPTAAIDMRADAPSACAAVAQLGPCVYMTDDEVRALLPVDRWMDGHHLSAAGAVSFTDWLAAATAKKLR